MKSVSCLALGLCLAASILAQDPAVIQIKSTPATPYAAGFSGLNSPQPRNGVEYYDPKFVAATAPLAPGWLRYPAGTASLAFDWNPANPTGGHINIDWMNSLISGSTPLISGQSATILTTSQLLTQAKGGVYLDAFATFAHAFGSSAVITVNSYTDKNLGSTTLLAQAAQRNGLHVIEWELGNEADLYPNIYPTAGDYAAAVYSPYYTDLMAGAPTATVGLFSAGQYTGSSQTYPCGLGAWFLCWDSDLSSYSPRYWNASSVHIYPIIDKQTTQNTIDTLNGVLAYGSSDYINAYINPLVGSTTPIFITEFNCCSQYGNKFLSYLYNGIFLAEYIARLSSVPNVKAVGINSLYTDNTDYHGLIQSVDDFESYLLPRVGKNPNYATNTATNPNTQFQFYMSAPGLAMEVANQAINSGKELLPTTSTGGLTVNISGFDGNPIPAIYAQAYGASGGLHYLLITNKSAKGQNVVIELNGKKVDTPLNMTYVSNTSAAAVNTAAAQLNVQIQRKTSGNPIHVGPYSVTTVTW